jgi:hypothetical protein
VFHTAVDRFSGDSVVKGVIAHDIIPFARIVTEATVKPEEAHEVFASAHIIHDRVVSPDDVPDANNIPAIFASAVVSPDAEPDIDTINARFATAVVSPSEFHDKFLHITADAERVVSPIVAFTAVIYHAFLGISHPVLYPVGWDIRCGMALLVSTHRSAQFVLKLARKFETLGPARNLAGDLSTDE